MLLIELFNGDADIPSLFGLTGRRLLFGYRKYLKTITTDNGSEFAANYFADNTSLKNPTNDFSDEYMRNIGRK